MKALPALTSLLSRTRGAVDKAALFPAHGTIKKEKLWMWVKIVLLILAYVFAKGLAGRP